MRVVNTGKRKSWYCGQCHKATLVSWSFEPNGHQARSKTFSELSLASSNWWYKHKAAKFTYPWCLTCHRPMMRCMSHGHLRYVCDNRKNHNGRKSYVSASYKSQSHNLARDEAIAKLVRSGYGVNQIQAKIGYDKKTINRVRELVPANEIARCDCGKLKYHRRGCKKKDDFNRLAAAQREIFDNIVAQLKQRLPERVPAEMREEVRQMLLLSIMEFTKHAVTNSHVLVQEYNRMFSIGRDISLDENPEKWISNLVADEFERQHASKAATEVYERDKRIIKLVRAGKSDTVIAEKLGIHRRTVGTVRKAAGLGKTLSRRYFKKGNTDITNKVRRLLDTVQTNREIAKLVGCNEHTVGKIRRAAGFAPLRKAG